MQEYRLTRESARAAGACYTDDQIAAIVPPEGLSHREVTALDIPAKDRVWALCCGAPHTVRCAFSGWCAGRAAAYAATATAAIAAAAVPATPAPPISPLAAAYYASVASAYAAAAAAAADAAAAAYAAADAAYFASASAADAAYYASAFDDERKAQIAELVRLLEETQ